MKLLNAAKFMYSEPAAFNNKLIKFKREVDLTMS